MIPKLLWAGLCGEWLRPFAKSLTGVDLSSKMLEIAQGKQIYDELIQADMTSFLKDKLARYELIVAGDAFVYVGDLGLLFKAIASALKTKGYFLFTTEISEKDDFYMTSSGRFAHSKPYIEKLLEENQLTIQNYQEVILRTHNHVPVFGHYYLAQKNAP